MIRKDINLYNDEEFEKIRRPFKDAIDDYFEQKILYDFVSFYLATGFEMNALWENKLNIHVYSAIATLAGMYIQNFDYKKLKNILKTKYNLIITSDSPMQIKKAS